MPQTGAMLARNSWNTAFGSRVAFARSGRTARQPWTGDRREFLGRNGTLDSPPRSRRAPPLSEPRRRRPRSLRRAADVASSSDRARRPRSSSSSARRQSTAEARVTDRALPRGRSRRGPARRSTRLLGRRARHRPGEDAGPLHGHHAQPLAALPDARLPHVGALGVLPGERRLRLPRPAPGRHGARRCRGRR